MDISINSRVLFEKVCNKYNLDNYDKIYLKNIVYPIINNDNFIKRCTNDFFHHDRVTLGEHIIEDTIVTYIISKKKNIKNYRIDLAIKIALLHDLYTIPWQNNKEAKVKCFFNKHGFRHPIESVINSINWYPEIYSNIDDSKIIIDGILHHMFPLPVRYLDNKVELKNRELLNNIDKKYIDIIDDSLKRKKVGPISITRSKYHEGRIMSMADKKVSRKEIKDISSVKSLLTGHNNKIK